MRQCWFLDSFVVRLMDACLSKPFFFSSLHIVNIVVKVMVMMVWIVIILESNFSNKFLLIRILWSQDYILTVYYPDGRPPTFIVFKAITAPKGKKVLIVDWSSQSIGTWRTAWAVGWGPISEKPEIALDQISSSVSFHLTWKGKSTMKKENSLSRLLQKPKDCLFECWLDVKMFVYL